ncbi:MAG: hypothetical protein ACOX4G_00845 [Limnochordia bacterium]
MIALLVALLLTGLLAATPCAAFGLRPYELDWAGRHEDDRPPLVDFEDLSGWRVETKNAQATFSRSRDQRIWGDYVGKLTYRATGSSPEVRILPPRPIPIKDDFDAVTMWVYGNTISDSTTPSISITAVFEDTSGGLLAVDLISIRWKEWFLCHRRLTPDQITQVHQGDFSFSHLLIRNGRNTDDRTVYFDNLAVFTEEWPALSFEPRPLRGIDMFPGQSTGSNTGPDRLPFPNRPETILPDNLTSNFHNAVSQEGNTFVFSYHGDDGQLTWHYTPSTGTWGDLTANWSGRDATMNPLVGGGIYLQVGNRAVAPEHIEPLGTERVGDSVVSRWRASAQGVSAEVTYTWRLQGKTLIVDTVALGGVVAEVRYGQAQGLHNPRLVTNPYYHYYREGRPAVIVEGPIDNPLFLTGNTDWYLSNASTPFSIAEITETGAVSNGGTRYLPMTNGQRNDCFERFFVTLTPHYEETLPNIPNPTSPWKKITGTKLWRAHGASNRQTDMAYWRRHYRWGIREMVVTDHETMWRDGEESFTFRTKAAPKKGGDEGALAYSRFMQDELGYVYGPYNNFTDFAPVNEFWSTDMVNRDQNNQLQHAWRRCYAPKPTRAVEYNQLLAPQIQGKFGFSTAYCDVHTAVSPWARVDYDYRVPGAGTFASVFYSYGEIMLTQKKAWNGPVYSEGNMHWMYSGLTDGNYAQDRGYDLPTQPWLVDFDLRKMHPLAGNFGMGSISMFYGQDYSLGDTPEQMDASIDRFLAATIAFGHPGFLVGDGGFQNTLRSYHMLQQLHSRYCLAEAEHILYADAMGQLHDVSSAVASGIYRRSQIVTRYSDGTVTVVNGSPTERMRVNAFNRELDLPPNGYAGWSADGAIDVISDDAVGHRADYAATPAYLYVDARGTFTRFAKAAGDGLCICRKSGPAEWEIIPYEGAICGFAIDGESAIALDFDGRELGPAKLRHSRGMTWVAPVEGAFSYLVRQGPGKNQALHCDRDHVVAGERVTVSGVQEHEIIIPVEAQPGEHIWLQIEDHWIDFVVVPLAEAVPTLEDNTLNLTLRSNLVDATSVEITLAGVSHELFLAPGHPATVSFDLGEPDDEMIDYLEIELRAGDLREQVEYGLQITRTRPMLEELPKQWSVGVALRGRGETADMTASRATVALGSRTCGMIPRKGFTMHPPYVGGTGYVFVLYEPMTIPDEPSALRAWVGKGDGSDLGDGILYKVAVITPDGEEHIVGMQRVTKHEWLELEGDLSAFSGQSVRLKLIADVGEANNSVGDWACVAEARIEARNKAFVRTLDLDPTGYRREPGPFPVSGLTAEDLRSATRGWLFYDGIGLSGTGDAYGSFAVLNGIELGNMAPAGGSETQNIWDFSAIPLTKAAIASLGFRNTFEIRNPKRDYFKVRRFWIRLDLADGRPASSLISPGVYTQPPQWPYAEGIGIPFTESISVDIWFDK